jgi:hypothetical protein
MSGKLRVVLLIIAGIGVGTAALVFGLLMLWLETYHSESAMIAAGWAGILAASSAGFAASVLGGLKHLDDRDDQDF